MLAWLALAWAGFFCGVRQPGASVDALDEEYLFVVVDFAEFDFNDLAVRGLDGAAYEAGFNDYSGLSAVAGAAIAAFAPGSATCPLIVG